MEWYSITAAAKTELKYVYSPMQ